MSERLYSSQQRDRPIRVHRSRCNRERRRNTYAVGTVGRLDASSVEEEADRSRLFPLSIAEGVHELFQRRRTLDLEEDFIVIVGDLDIEVLGSWRFIRLSRPRRCIAVRHGSEKF